MVKRRRSTEEARLSTGDTPYNKLIARSDHDTKGGAHGKERNDSTSIPSPIQITLHSHQFIVDGVANVGCCNGGAADVVWASQSHKVEAPSYYLLSLYP